MDFYRPPVLYEALEAIGSVYRAMRAWQFYPAGHPTRKTSIIKAHAALRSILGEHDLTLLCGSAGFTFPDGESIRDVNRLCDSLSFELFVRRVKAITLLHDLRQEDLLDLVRVLMITPEGVQAAGGVDTMFAQHGVSTIWVNEYDLSIIRRQRQQRESSGITPPVLDDVELAEGATGDDVAMPENGFSSTAIDPQQELQSLLSQLVSTQDETFYQMYLHQAVACADQVISVGMPQLVIPLVELLAEQVNDVNYSPALRQMTRYGLEQLASDERLVKYIFSVMEENSTISTVGATVLLQLAPVQIAPLIVEAVGMVKSFALRKTLNHILTDWGDRALPLLLPLLEDARWHIVRNVCAVVGSIGNPEAMPALLPLLKHGDIRVSKEAVRSLAKIGGNGAESALLTTMRQGNSLLLPQLMASLGGMKSKKALVELLTVVFTGDMFLNNLQLKCEALAAIALVGEPAIAPKVAELLDARFLLAPGRTSQLKIAAADCLARLGNRSVVPALRRHVDDGDGVGKACRAALETLESRTANV